MDSLLNRILSISSSELIFIVEPNGNVISDVTFLREQFSDLDIDFTKCSHICNLFGAAQKCDESCVIHNSVHKKIDVTIMREYVSDNTTLYFRERIRSLMPSDHNLPKLFAISISPNLIGEIEDYQILKAIANNAKMSILVTDIEGTIEYVNDFFCILTGYSRSEVIGHKPNILKGEFTASGSFKELWDTILNKEVWTGILHNTRKDGSSFWDMNVIIPLLSKSGELKKFISIKTDITNHHIVEEKLLEKSRMETVGRLSGAVTHDFNNILTVINGFAELGLDSYNESPEIVEEYFNGVLEAVEKASSLTSQLLLYSRSVKKAPIEVEFFTFIQDSAKFLRRLIPEYIRFDVQIPRSDILLKADKGELEQILVNLSVNAVDAINCKSEQSVNEQIKISVDIVNGNDVKSPYFDLIDSTYMQLSFSDTGCGMSESVQNKIFEPFFTTKSEGEGTGLGMSTVYKIIKNNCAGIDLESNKNKGTNFRIFWPCTLQCKNTKILKNKSELILGNKETILVVEDDVRVLTIIESQLEILNYSIIPASNGIEALDLIKKNNHPVDIVLTDLVMPYLNGVDTFIEITKTIGDIPVLFMSGYTDSVVPRSIKNVVNQYEILQKPLSTTMLSEHIAKALNTRSTSNGSK